MDAKSRAEFIHSIAQGQAAPCPVCGGQNSPENRFCIFCGARIAAEPVNNFPAFAPVSVDAGQPLVSDEGNMAAEPANSNPPAFAPVSADAGLLPVSDEESSAAEPVNNVPAFAPASADAGQSSVSDVGNMVERPANNNSPAFSFVSQQVQTQEGQSPFAEGLPSWDIVPPEVMVRRRSVK